MTGTSQTLKFNVDTSAFEDQIPSVILGDALMIMKENAVADSIAETELTMMNLVDSIKLPLMPRMSLKSSLSILTYPPTSRSLKRSNFPRR